MEEIVVDPSSFIPETPKMSAKDVVDAFPSVQLNHIEKVVSPVIIKCNLGGFIVSVPGRGIAAKSTFEEAMKFLSEEAHKECYGRDMGLPAVVNKMYERTEVALQGQGLNIFAACSVVGALAAITWRWLA